MVVTFLGGGVTKWGN